MILLDQFPEWYPGLSSCYLHEQKINLLHITQQIVQLSTVLCGTVRYFGIQTLRTHTGTTYTPINLAASRYQELTGDCLLIKAHQSSSPEACEGALFRLLACSLLPEAWRLAFDDILCVLLQVNDCCLHSCSSSSLRLIRFSEFVAIATMTGNNQLSPIHRLINVHAGAILELTMTISLWLGCWLLVWFVADCNCSITTASVYYNGLASQNIILVCDRYYLRTKSVAVMNFMICRTIHCVDHLLRLKLE